jgi:hypothetical protein
VAGREKVLALRIVDRGRRISALLSMLCLFVVG